MALHLVKYSPPAWAAHLKNVPSHCFQFGQFPTPVHRFGLRDREFWIKRDDISECALGGNKIRKLNFLMADAVKQGSDCVVTVGGVQSNHARATALFARRLGLDPYLVLRVPEDAADPEHNVTAVDAVAAAAPQGNLFLNRLCGAHVRLVTRDQYARHGQMALLENLAMQLKREGRTPYIIPVGGSTPVGLWGYLEAVREFHQQYETLWGGGVGVAAGATPSKLTPPPSRIVFACGSGGTAAGLSLGVHLSELPVAVHAVAVCDSAAAFYEHVDGAMQSVGLQSGPAAASSLRSARSLLTVDDSFKGRYVDHPNHSSPEELDLLCEASHATGIPFDPCYSIKALRVLLAEDRAPQPDGSTLFWHTGGVFGSFGHAERLLQEKLFRGSIEHLQTK